MAQNSDRGDKPRQTTSSGNKRRKSSFHPRKLKKQLRFLRNCFFKM